MNPEVDKLQGLLRRVEANRRKPRSVAGEEASAKAGVARGVEARAAAPAAEDPFAGTGPRERARASVRSAPASEPSGPPQRAVRSPAAESPPARQAAVASPIIIDPGVAQVSKPVVQVVSKHPPPVALSFGELLRRSLSLRPR